MVRGTPIVTRVKFGKCRHKYLCEDWLNELVGKTFEVVAYQPHWIHDRKKGWEDFASWIKVNWKQDKVVRVKSMIVSLVQSPLFCCFPSDIHSR